MYTNDEGKCGGEKHLKCAKEELMWRNPSNRHELVSNCEVFSRGGSNKTILELKSLDFSSLDDYKYMAE